MWQSVASAGVVVSLTPLKDTLVPLDTTDLTATVTGSPNTAVTWIAPLIGTLVVNGNNATYTAPAVISGLTSVAVTAISVADPRQSIFAIIKLTPQVVVSLNPPLTTLSAGGSQQLSVAVTGTPNNAVTWSVAPNVGTLSNGLYTAPATVAAAQNVVITARSVVDPTAFATATVSLTPVGLTLTPPSASTPAGTTQQLTAAVTGSANTGVTWSLQPALGSISSTGLYTAPAIVASAQTVTVTARSVADPNVFASSTISLTPVAITLNPPSVSVEAGNTQQLTALVTGLLNTAVNFTMQPSLGTLSANGLYTAPNAVALPQTVTITATSVANTTLTASATITVTPVTLSLTPGVLSVAAANTVQLNATLTGAANSSVTWSLQPNFGSISNTGLYTAPGSVSTPQTVIAKVQSVSHPNLSATSTITVTPITLTLSPGSSTVGQGASQQLVATVVGSANQGVTYSLSPSLGTISATGLYTAPASAANGVSVTVTATSVADPSLTASATITIVGGVTITMGTQGLTSLTYAGANMILNANQKPGVAHAQFRDASGNLIVGSPNATKLVVNAATNTVSQNFAWGTVVTTYTPQANKLLMTVDIQNNTANTMTHFWMFPLAVQLPATPTNLNLNTIAAFNIDAPTSIYWNYGSGTIDLANDDPVKPLGVAWRPAANPPANKWNLSIDFDDGQNVSKTWQPIPRPIPPGGSDTYTVSIRFGDQNADELQLAGDVFASYRAAFPQQVILPNPPRPISALNITSKPRPFFPTNPRGWLNDPTIDVTTPQGIAAFQARLMKWANGAVYEMKRVGALGGILWDMEGQQFDIAYIGDPTQLETISPELVGILDTFMNAFTSAGLRIGLGLRQQAFSMHNGFVNVNGTQVTWAGGTQFGNWAFSPVVSGSFTLGQNNYTIQSVQSPTQLTLATPAPSGTGIPFIYAEQLNTPDPCAVLKQKVQYAYNRWHATMFYIDSNLDYAGTITPSSCFQDLITTYPGMLFLPEWESIRHYAYTLPYNNTFNSIFGPPASAKQVYPTATTVLKVTDVTAKSFPTQITNALNSGNVVLLYDGWYHSTASDFIIQLYSQLH